VCICIYVCLDVCVYMYVHTVSIYHITCIVLQMAFLQKPQIIVIYFV
jgi:hypothetical protein